MDAFISRKKRKPSPGEYEAQPNPKHHKPSLIRDDGEESTDLKLAILSSLHPLVDQAILLDALIAAHGSVSETCTKLDILFGGAAADESPKKKASGVARGVGFQSSLSAYRSQGDNKDCRNTTDAEGRGALNLTRRGQTLHLYSPDDIAAHTPCSIIHNFLPALEAEDLLKELLLEAPTFEKQTFKLFENVVQSPHTACFYVESLEERKRQETEYLYNGSYLTDIRQIPPHMLAVSAKVKTAVNVEIARRIKSHYLGGKKLKYQSPEEWEPNAAFVNCYKGGAESVGYHSDQLTYLGPRAIIGSLSLGVARQFRVRKIVARNSGENEADDAKAKDTTRADAEGQIAIHLPHNSLLVMHAEMQEEWKHSIHPAQAIDPHPVAGNKRINITYRHYRKSLHPRFTPRCKCKVACVLRCVQRKKENRGRYMWMCHTGQTPGKEGCSFFQWAEFDDDGNPPWMDKVSAG